VGHHAGALERTKASPTYAKAVCAKGMVNGRETVCETSFVTPFAS